MFIWTRGANNKKTATDPKEAVAIAGRESTLILFMAPEMEILAWQMERERSKNVSSWEWKATTTMAKKKPESDNKMIFLTSE